MNHSLYQEAVERCDGFNYYSSSPITSVQNQFKNKDFIGNKPKFKMVTFNYTSSMIVVPVWSGVNVAGVRLRDVSQDFASKNGSDGFNRIHKEVVDSAYEIIRLKGYTSWAIGLSVSKLCQVILHNVHSVHAVTTAVKVSLDNFLFSWFEDLSI